jgi:hypothetical protein
MRKIACLIVLFGLVAVSAFAQRTSGAIRGTVTDSSGAVIPGATVTVKSEGTGFNRSTVTNTEGVYSFPELPVGTYSVEVALQGFKTAVQTGIPLNVADVLAVNVQLEPGALNETITVESSTTTVKTVGGEVAGLVTGADGRFVAFDSSANTLVPADNNAEDDVFVHDCETGETTRVSVSSSGEEGKGDSDYPDLDAELLPYRLLIKEGLVQGLANRQYLLSQPAMSRIVLS